MKTTKVIALEAIRGYFRPLTWLARKIKRRIWIRKDEFHCSLNMNENAILKMNEKEIEDYFARLAKRRNIAHQKDFFAK